MPSATKGPGDCQPETRALGSRQSAAGERDSQVEFDGLRTWVPPVGWTTITTIDAHSGGEPLRIILDGAPSAAGKQAIPAHRRHPSPSLDNLRRALIWEPRGHRDMFGCVITPPKTEAAVFGLVFIHTEGCSAMCGHGIIAAVTVAVETGLVTRVEPDTPVCIDTQAGLVRAVAKVRGNRVRSVAFRNVPSFAVAFDETIAVDGLGTVRYDLAFGGAFYAYVEAASVGLRLATEEYAALVDKGMAIKLAIAAVRPIQHPCEPEFDALYGTIFIGPPLSSEANNRNVCIFGDGQVDRSPTGTGLSGWMALAHARGTAPIGAPLVVESIVGSRFTGRVIEATTCGGRPAVIPEVEGTAHITGLHQFVFDPDDELAGGFLL